MLVWRMTYKNIINRVIVEVSCKAQKIIYLIFTIILTTTASFSQQQKIPKSSDFYHTYKKEGDIIRVYDVDKNLVREVYLGKGIAYNIYNKDILLTHMQNRFFLKEPIINSCKTKEYLYTGVDCKYFIQTDEGAGYTKKYKIDTYGFKKLVFSSSIYDNEPSPPLLSDKEMEKIDKEQDSLARLQPKVNYRIEEKHNNDVFKYTTYKNDKKEIEYIIKFNGENLVSNVYLLFIIDGGTPQERYDISIQKAFYDQEKNLIKIKEWTSKNYNQFKDVIQDKGEEFFIDEVFKNPEKCFNLDLFLTTEYVYNKDCLLIEKKSIYHSYNNEITKVVYDYDIKKRLVKSTTFFDDIIQKQDVFSYD